MKCNLCNSRNIVWSDFCYKRGFSDSVSLGLCWKCLKIVNWENEINKILPKLSSCSTCHEKFIPKFSTQVICGMCWLKSRNITFTTYANREKIPTSDNNLNKFLEVQHGTY